MPAMASCQLAHLIVPTLCVVMHPVTLRVTIAQDLGIALAGGTRSVPGGIPTQSVGTIKLGGLSDFSCKILGCA